ncbi:HEPN/Toprim-associated domain-containing protein [Paracoccus sp. 1_MG-2023]|nr:MULTISPECIES: HEPN/Toprim-associated domain-containing protein [unclassified Paracoccus (in: a-proteobacteria)]MDO6670430.1 HEPN/Toprim-associated domain-containing protein [Paracoccus sp. 1_MG-2023]
MTLRLGGMLIETIPSTKDDIHAALFQKGDARDFSDDELHADELAARERLERENAAFGYNLEGTYVQAARRTLRAMVDRLDLLDFGLERAEERFRIGTCDLDSILNDKADVTVTFAEVVDLCRRHPVADLLVQPVDLFAELLALRSPIQFAWVENQDELPPGIEQLGALLDAVPPLCRLRILAECPKNLDQEVIWHYGPAITDMEMSEEQVRLGPSRLNTYLVITEGKTDVAIIEAALRKLRPDLADFFRFVSKTTRDSGWLFEGAGEIPKILYGLSELGAGLRVIGIFDNDVQGWTSFKTIDPRAIGPYCRAMVLPSLPEFERFETYGPGPEPLTLSINQVGAPIEAYLDLTRKDIVGRCVLRWQRWHSDHGKYAGAVEPKEPPQTDFLKWCAIEHGRYNTSKIEAVLDALVGEAKAMAIRVGHRNFHWSIGKFE